MKKSCRRFFLFDKIFTNIRKNENLRNEDSEILFVTKTIVCGPRLFWRIFSAPAEFFGKSIFHGNRHQSS